MSHFLIISFSFLFCGQKDRNWSPNMVESRVAGKEKAGQSAIIKMYVVWFGPLVLRQRQAEWRMQNSLFPKTFTRHITAPSPWKKHQILMTFGQPISIPGRLKKGEIFSVSAELKGKWNKKQNNLTQRKQLQCSTEWYLSYNCITIFIAQDNTAVVKSSHH